MYTIFFISSAPTLGHGNINSPTNEAIDQKEMNVTSSLDHVSQISSLNFTAMPSCGETKKTLREEQKKFKIEQKNLKLEQKKNTALKCQLLKHPLLSSCQCRKGRTLQMVKGDKEYAASVIKKPYCLVNIPEERRVKLHEQFWSLFRDARLAWVDKHIKLFAGKNSKKLKIGQKTGQNQKALTRKYFLPGVDGANVEVCQLFFFRTLGYPNSNFIRTLFKNTSSSRIRPQSGKLDKHNPVNKVAGLDCDQHKKDKHHAGTELTCSVSLREKLYSHRVTVEITRLPAQKNCKNHVEIASHPESASGGIFFSFFL